MLWIVGVVVLFDALYKMPSRYTKRVGLSGLTAANAGLGYAVLVLGKAPWHVYMRWILWPWYVVVAGRVLWHDWNYEEEVEVVETLEKPRTGEGLMTLP